MHERISKSGKSKDKIQVVQKKFPNKLVISSSGVNDNFWLELCKKVYLF